MAPSPERLLREAVNSRAKQLEMILEPLGMPESKEIEKIYGNYQRDTGSNLKGSPKGQSW